MDKLTFTAFTYAKKTSARSGPIPILKCALVKDGVLHATNMDQQLSHRVNGLEDGIYDIAKSYALKDAIKSDLPGADFPVLANPECKNSYKFHLETLHSVARFTSREEARYYLKGLFFHTDNVVGVNGHIMCRSRKFKHNLPNVILPKDAIDLLPKKGDVWICVNSPEPGSNGAVRITMKMSDDFVIVSRAIDGKFPDYEKAIPGTELEPTNCKMPEDWYEKCDLAVKLYRAENGTNCRFIEVVPIKFYERGDFGFNALNLMLLPRHVSRYFQVEPSQPARWDCEDETYVIMPTRP